MESYTDPRDWRGAELVAFLDEYFPGRTDWNRSPDTAPEDVFRVSAEWLSEHPHQMKDHWGKRLQLPDFMVQLAAALDAPEKLLNDAINAVDDAQVPGNAQSITTSIGNVFFVSSVERFS